MYRPTRTSLARGYYTPRNRPLSLPEIRPSWRQRVRFPETLQLYCKCVDALTDHMLLAASHKYLCRKCLKTQMVENVLLVYAETDGEIQIPRREEVK